MVRQSQYRVRARGLLGLLLAFALVAGCLAAPPVEPGGEAPAEGAPSGEEPTGEPAAPPPDVIRLPDTLSEGSDEAAEDPFLPKDAEVPVNVSPGGNSSFPGPVEPAVTPDREVPDVVAPTAPQPEDDPAVA